MASPLPRVDFYLVDGGESARDQFCCRLVEKAYRAGYRVHLRTPDRAAAERLDTRLWTFRPGSFVPHALLPEAQDEPVTLGETLPAEAGGLLVNLGEAPDLDACPWSRIAEVAAAAGADLDAARKRFKAYREAGCEPRHHRIAGAS
ncbi:MAG TPA: DNA polymerase III subunit chi [Pseudohaliea sp.]|nr:DNA polymerase III subunit chi [Pseudohaliea sp.]